MNVHRLTTTPPPALAAALARFESDFSYPLGTGRTFRIEHGEDYPRFFRAIGDAVCIIAESEGRILGCLAVAVRRLLLPNGEERSAAYLADLKIAPRARGGFVLMRLVRAVEKEIGTIGACFGVVMGGSRVTPADYTGRAGIPLFAELARIAVLRIATMPAPFLAANVVDESRVRGVYRRLSRGRYACPAGRSSERSQSPPVWLVHPLGDACGRLEDTRLAKRLVSDGGELLSTHLSDFAYRTPQAGAQLIEAALAKANDLGFPALFVAVPLCDGPALCQELPGWEVAVAPAGVYGCGLSIGPEWNINTAEI